MFCGQLLSGKGSDVMNVVVMADQIQVRGTGSSDQEIADWISKYLFDNDVIYNINKSGKLVLNDAGRTSADSWVYIDSIINEEELILKACELLKIDNTLGYGGIVYHFIPLDLKEKTE